MLLLCTVACLIKSPDHRLCTRNPQLDLFNSTLYTPRVPRRFILTAVGRTKDVLSLMLSMRRQNCLIKLDGVLVHVRICQQSRQYEEAKAAPNAWVLRCLNA
jgi:hypothetical protein